jgi:ADP-ribose pyrophosphatase YjhB (NUDIX family)
MSRYAFCPHCARALRLNKEGLPSCVCGFTHWDNPVPVVACLVPMQREWLKKTHLPYEEFPDDGVLLVQRNRAPFAGEWCLPCGFMNKHGHPKEEATREVFEETGVHVRIEKMLCACNPMPGEINQIVISYLARPIGGILRAGDDARDARVFSRDDAPDLCFRSHQMLLDHWFGGHISGLTGVDLHL